MASVANAEIFDALAVKDLFADKLTLKALTTVTTIEVANATQTITISALGPAGIGTATIKGWLQFTDSAGVVNYIPYWS